MLTKVNKTPRSIDLGGFSAEISVAHYYPCTKSLLDFGLDDVDDI